MLKPLSTFLRLPWREQLWFLLLWPASGLVRAMILLVPFRWYARLLGERMGNDQLRMLVDEQGELRAWRIGRIVGQVARFTPWESKCLVQAILARLMCGWYRTPYVLHLGVTRSGAAGKPLKAHAWLSVGRWIVVGGEGSRAFTVVSTYVPPKLLTETGKLHG